MAEDTGMVTGDGGHPFEPDWTLSPGTLLRAFLIERGLSAAQAAEHAGLGDDVITGILSAGVEITGPIAERLAAGLPGPSATYWLNSQRIYQQDLARGAKDCSRGELPLP